MKKLILILFLIPSILNAQIELSEDYSFKKDKKIHTVTANVASAGIYLGVYFKTGDAGLAFRATWMSVTGGSLLWEMKGMIQGKEISLGDISYGIGTALGTSALMYCGTKVLEKWKVKRTKKNSIQAILESEDINFALENEIFKK